MVDLLVKVAAHSFSRCINEVQSGGSVLGRTSQGAKLLVHSRPQSAKSPCIEEFWLSKCQPRHVGLFPFFYFEEIKERFSQGGEDSPSPRQLRRLRWCLREIKLYFIFVAVPQRVAVEPGQTPVFHTFFLPKRERKYQRKRFRAAAKTPRGHRGCSALSAHEMRHRLQRCNCSSQNEALAPLPGRKTHVFGGSRDVSPKTPEGRRSL